MPLDENRVRNFVFPEVPVRIGTRDALLYALGLGFGSEPTNTRHLRYVYEKDLAVFPTMPLVLGSPGNWFEAAGLNFRKLVHGGQAINVTRPVPLDTPLVARSRVTDVRDLGADKGAVVAVERKLEQVGGEAVASLISTYVFRGDGGFGGLPPERSDGALPAGQPDVELVLPILPQAALLYRLNGDMNPLHADPERASAVGFDRPILHGLCTFAMAGRALVEAVAPDAPEALRSMSGRFSRPVYPGETLRVQLWRRDPEIRFQVSVDERDMLVMTDGRATFSL